MDLSEGALLEVCRVSDLPGWQFVEGGGFEIAPVFLDVTPAPGSVERWLGAAFGRVLPSTADGLLILTLGTSRYDLGSLVLGATYLVDPVLVPRNRRDRDRGRRLMGQRVVVDAVRRDPEHGRRASVRGEDGFPWSVPADWLARVERVEA